MAGFFLYANVYIALCAAACVAGTLRLFGYEKNSLPLLAVAASSVLLVYNLHYYFSGNKSRSKRMTWFAANRLPVQLLVLAALACFCWFLPRLHYRQIAATGITGLLAMAYSMPLLPGRKRLNQFGIIKILVLSGCWTVFTTYWPVAGKPISPSFLWLIITERWLFFFILCLLLDIRDLDADAARRVQTVAVRLGTAGSYRLAAWLTGALVLLNTVHAVQGHPPALFNAFFLTTLLTGFIIWLCRNQPRPLTWLVGIDGLLLAHGLLLLAM
jgi:4-hydroxybenzoate polyprenyltransferase